MHLNLKKIINDLLLQESVREIDTFINQQRNEIEKETLRTFFDKFKTYSGSNPNQTLAQIDVPFFKWLFNVSVEQNQNITDQELNHFFDISILYFNNKNKFSFNFKQNPPTWNTFETEVINETSKLNLVQLISKDINTKWFDSNNSKVNKPEIIKRFKEWNEESELTPTEKQENILVVVPRTTLSAKFWGNPICFGNIYLGFGVKWCTSATQSGNMFHQYTIMSDSRLIYIIDLSKPDRDPWQKIAVLINNSERKIEIFDATDESYSVKGIEKKTRQGDINVEILKLIKEIIKKYSNTPNNQYSPSQFQNLSHEEKHTLFLTTLKDLNSKDKNYIQKNFKDFFDDPITSEQQRKQIIKNIIGFSDNKDINDKQLIDLIEQYLNDSNNHLKYYEIIKHVNSTEKQSKAVKKFYENKTFFSDNFQELNTEHWKLFEKYLNNQQKIEIAIKFIINSKESYPATWNDLAKYLKPANRSNTAFNIIAEQNFERSIWEYFSQYLTDQDKRKLAEEFILNRKEYNKFIWRSLSEYLTDQEKNNWIEFILFENEFDRYTWDDLIEYLNNDQIEKLANKYFLDDDYFYYSVWNELYDYLSVEKKREIANKFIMNSDYFDNNLWDYLNQYLSDDDKRKIAEKFILNKEKFDHAWKTLEKYLTNNDKRKLAEKFILNKEKFDRTILDAWETLEKYLTNNDKRKLAEKFILNQYNILTQNNYKPQKYTSYASFLNIKQITPGQDIYNINSNIIIHLRKKGVLYSLYEISKKLSQSDVEKISNTNLFTEIDNRLDKLSINDLENFVANFNLYESINININELIYVILKEFCSENNFNILMNVAKEAHENFDEYGEIIQSENQIEQTEIYENIEFAWEYLSSYLTDNEKEKIIKVFNISESYKRKIKLLKLALNNLL